MMNALQNWYGWARENWSDLASAFLGILALVLALVPTKVAEIERSWWRKGILIIAVLFLGITGTISGILGKSRLQDQINALTASSLVSATKSDIQNLTQHIDDGFTKVVNAVSSLGSKPETHKGGDNTTPKVSQLPPERPPLVEHLRFTEKQVPSNNPSAPHAMQVIIQTDVTLQPMGLEIDTTLPIEEGNFFVAGSSVVMSKGTALSADKKSFLLSFKYPPFTPESPIIVTIDSEHDFDVTRIKQIPPLF